MTQEIKAYFLTVNAFLSEEHTPEEKTSFKNDMRTRISFYQHERFIHLLVMALIALLTLMSFIATAWHTEFLPLAALFLVLLVPYIFHYYFLENSVQKLYKLYYKL
jgi:hypothetical protein